MNYKKHYDTLIERSKLRILPKGTYTETHHIIPVCLRPDLRLDKSNMVELLAREHFIAHQLLYKMYKNTEWEVKMFTPMIRMSGYSSLNQSRNNKIFEWMRIRNAELASKNLSGKKKTPEHIANSGYALKHHKNRKEINQKISKANSGENNGMFGKISAVRIIFSEEDELKIVEMYKSGLRSVKIGLIFGVSRTPIDRILNFYGMPVKSKCNHHNK